MTSWQRSMSSYVIVFSPPFLPAASSPSASSIFCNRPSFKEVAAAAPPAFEATFRAERFEARDLSDWIVERISDAAIGLFLRTLSKLRRSF